VKLIFNLHTESISSDPPGDESTPSLESSCVEMNWLDLIRKGTHLSIEDLTAHSACQSTYAHFIFHLCLCGIVLSSSFREEGRKETLPSTMDGISSYTMCQWRRRPVRRRYVFGSRMNWFEFRGERWRSPWPLEPPTPESICSSWSLLRTFWIDADWRRHTRR